MAESTSLVNLGELSKPATVLVEKIADAVGGFFRPYQIRRVAKAEADAEKIDALMKLELSDLQQRALHRFIAEEAKKQDNIEAITAQALPNVADDAKAEEVDNDWITNFFDKCRLISTDEMQTLWARLLAGEANSPGTYSKRTIDYLASLDRNDAELFSALCGFSCYTTSVLPLIYSVDIPLYTDAGITFESLTHLDAIGLLRFETVVGFRLIDLPKHYRIQYYGTPIDLEFPNDQGNALSIGKVMLSKVGQELAPICRPKPVVGFIDYLTAEWSARGIACSLASREGSA